MPHLATDPNHSLVLRPSASTSQQISVVSQGESSTEDAVTLAYQPGASTDAEQPHLFPGPAVTETSACGPLEASEDPRDKAGARGSVAAVPTDLVKPVTEVPELESATVELPIMKAHLGVSSNPTEFG